MKTNSYFDDQKLQKIIHKTIDNKKVFSCVFSIHKEDEQWAGCAGSVQTSDPYFIASITKLYVTAILMQMRSKREISIDDKISKYLSSDNVNQLHVFKGKDYSNEITIRHLLSQTSGLPDYFEDKKNNGKSLLNELVEGLDQEWTFEECLQMSKQMSPKFIPGQKGKAHYSDTNFQLLGKIIENITGLPSAEAFKKYLFDPLNLSNTYLYSKSDDNRPAQIYFKDKPLHILKAMTSFTSDGGIVSTADESMVFLKAFFSGVFFPKEYFSEMYKWNRVMFPLEYGIGVMRFKLPRIFSPFQPLPQFVGHSGLSGAVAFFIPEKNIYVTGTVNQVHYSSVSFKLMLKLVNSIR